MRLAVKLVSKILLITLVICTLVVPFEIQKTKAQPPSQAWIAVNLPKQVFEFKDFFEPLDVSDPYKGKIRVEIEINVTNLYALEYKLRWNNTLLDATDYTILSPWDTYTVYANDTIDLESGHSEHYLGVEADETAESLPFNGATTVFSYLFLVKQYPFYPNSNAVCFFDLTDTLFLTPTSEPIDHVVCSGGCELLREVIPLVEVDSINWTLPVGSNCTIYVRISKVTKERIQDYCEEFMGVWGMVLDLYFDTEYLDALSIEPNRTAPKSPAGHFFEPSNPNNLWFAEVSIIDDYFGNGTYGRARVAFTILLPEEPKLGGGVLARINFNITASGTGRPLRLYAPGHPFPLHLSYMNDKLKLAGVVPCTVGEVELEFTPPAVCIVSPENRLYTSTSVQLNFTVDEPAYRVGYSLDGQDFVIVTGNITLANLSLGEHRIRVYATDFRGNRGWATPVCFTVSVLGDVGGNGEVDVYDLVIWGTAYGSEPGYPNWNPIADLNRDGVVNIFDGVIIGTTYGKKF
jgi:hypothetical protein